MGEIIEDAESQSFDNHQNYGKIYAQHALQLSRTFDKSAYFMQNKANFKKSQIDIKLNVSSDYEKKSKRTLGENKPKQSQSFDFAQDKFFKTEGRKRMTKDRSLPACGRMDAARNTHDEER
jgi:hypothetical protein